MIKDLMNHDLKKEDFVLLHSSAVPPMVVYRIKNISEGGLVIPVTHVPGAPKGSKVLQGGQLVLYCEVILNFDPTQPIPVYRVDEAPAVKVDA